MKKSIITFGIALVAMVVTSCGAAKGGAPIDILTAPTWELSNINGHDVVRSDYAKAIPYVNFSTDNKVGGNGGCNTFGGSYNLNEEGGINLSQIFATKMFCEGQGENEFMAALNKVNNSKIDSQKLVLMEGITEVMTFVPKERKNK